MERHHRPQEDDAPDNVIASLTMIPASRGHAATVLGRYVVFEEIAAGGMATVHLGRLRGAAGFARMVAVKRLHRQYAKDPEFVAMLVDEARLAGRIHHPNVVTMLDVAAEDGELVLVMEYVHGEPLAKLLRTARRKGLAVPPRIAATILTETLYGLHAAHEARDERGMELGIVHRDVSPQNIIVGADGVTRVLDFGIAKAAGRIHSTREGEIKGKFAYMPPEQLHGEHLDRRADIYAAGVVLWETLTGERLFLGSAEMPDLQRLLDADVEPPSTRVSGLHASFDAVAMKALAREPDDRYPTARAMAVALEACGPAATASEVSEWVEVLANDSLSRRALLIATLEGLAEPAPQLGAISDDTGETLTIPIPLPLLHVPEDDDPPPLRRQLDTIPLGAIAVVERTPAVVAQKAEIAAAEKVDLGPVERTEITASRAARAPLDRGSPRRSALIGVGLAALSVSLSFLIWTRPPTSQGAAPEDAPPLASASAEPAPSAREIDLEGPAPTATIATAEPPPSAAPSVAAARPPRTPPRVPPRVVDANPCSPPYSLDAQGHKHYKRECL
jgi:eukaryotic-like serine/threonine-protein kinase